MTFYDENQNKIPETKLINSTIIQIFLQQNNFINLSVPKQKSQDKDKPIAVPKGLLINKVKQFSLVHMLTHNMSIRPDRDYQTNLVSIVKMDTTFKLANGVNLPKIILSWGSDGIARKQLVKGRDDLRQDAIMQQFFVTVNDLIKSNNDKVYALVKLT